MNSLFIMTVTIYRDRAFRNPVVNFLRRGGRRWRRYEEISDVLRGMRAVLETSVLIAGNLEALPGELAISAVSIPYPSTTRWPLATASSRQPSSGPAANQVRGASICLLRRPLTRMARGYTRKPDDLRGVEALAEVIAPADRLG